MILWWLVALVVVVDGRLLALIVDRGMA